MTPQALTPARSEIELFREEYQNWIDNLPESERKEYGKSVTGKEEMLCDFFELPGTQRFLSEFTKETRLVLNRAWGEAAKTAEGKPLIAALRAINHAIQRERE